MVQQAFVQPHIAHPHQLLLALFAHLLHRDAARLPNQISSSLAANKPQQTRGWYSPQSSYIGNANRAWDIDELLWDSRGNLDPRGRLGTDRPHVIKLYGSKSFKWSDTQGSDIGMFFYGGSGTPLSTLVNTINGTQTFVNGRGDLGRTPFLTQTDVVVAHEVSVSKNKKLRFEFNAQNLFSQKTARSRWTQLNRARTSAEIDLSKTDLAKGYDFMSMINGTSEGAKAFSPLFGMEDWFNPGFSAASW